MAYKPLRKKEKALKQIMLIDEKEETSADCLNYNYKLFEVIDILPSPSPSPFRRSSITVKG